MNGRGKDGQTILCWLTRLKGTKTGLQCTDNIRCHKFHDAGSSYVVVDIAVLFAGAAEEAAEELLI